MGLNLDLDEDLENYFLNIRKDFPILDRNINGKPLVYVDNAATTQKPRVLIEGISKIYSKNYANIHRGIGSLSQEITNMYENSRNLVANFIGANSNEIIFTSGATDSVNILVNGLRKYFKKGDGILLSKFEHHANLVPWLNLAKELELNIFYMENLDGDNFEIDLKSLEKDLKDNSKEIKFVSLLHASNVLGNLNNIEGIIELVRKYSNALIAVDLSSSISHIKLDVNYLDLDFCFFSAHKIYGPSGVGVLYGKKKNLDLLVPFKYGGGMINEVYYDNFSCLDLPNKFEAGTPNIEGVIGFGIVLKYLMKIGMDKINKWELYLTKYFLENIAKLDDFELYGSSSYENRVPIFSFNIRGVHSHDVSTILDKYGIQIRGGHHCAMPLHNELLNIPASNRISISFYNTKEEIDYIIKVLSNIKKEFDSGSFLL